jgi:hypothetical protein
MIWSKKKIRSRELSLIKFLIRSSHILQPTGDRTWDKNIIREVLSNIIEKNKRISKEAF